MRKFSILASLAFALTFTLNAALIPISYSGSNGAYYFINGYGDNAYVSSSCSGCPGFLSGGLGELTDGVTVPSFFGGDNHTYMMGWPSPEVTLTFFFDGGQNFGSVGIHVANAHGAAGIGLPLTATISAGTPQVFTFVGQSPTGTPNEWHWFDLAPGTQGASLDLQLTRNDVFGQWMFIDEVAFLSSSEVQATPEPATLAIAAAGLALVAAVRKRRS